MQNTEDKLDVVFKMQKQLNDYITQTRNLNFTSEEWLQKRALALIEEITEVLNEANYKWWKNPKPVDRSALKEELVDVLHFYVGMCIDAGISSQELFDAYITKNEENYKRQQGLSDKKGYSLNE